MNRTFEEIWADPLESKFLLAIAADPAARPVYADWLEEREDPRGEYLRLGAALAGLPEGDGRIPALQVQFDRLQPHVDLMWRQMVRLSPRVLARGGAEVVPAARGPDRWIRNPIEREFLQLIQAEPAVRPIYAAWLEDRGDPRGEYLRLEIALAAPPRDDERLLDLPARLDRLRTELEPFWLGLVDDRSRVLNCGAAASQPPLVRFAFKCPKRWERLRRTGDDAVRFCEACGCNVHFCTTTAEAEQRAVRGECIAIGPRLAREVINSHPDENEDILMGIAACPPGAESFERSDLEALGRWGRAIQERPGPAQKRPWWRFWG